MFRKELKVPVLGTPGEDVFPEVSRLGELVFCDQRLDGIGVAGNEFPLVVERYLCLDLRGVYAVLCREIARGSWLFLR